MKAKTIVLFDPGSIELTITGAIKKNTLPAVRGEWAAWLDSFKASEMETDQDFADAAKFVTECKRVEERFANIREEALKGKIFEAIKELETMGETTRQKRLEFDRAVTARKNEVRTEAIAKALKSLADALAAFPHRRAPRNAAEQPDAMLFAAIKGKSAILKMQEALETESARIVAEAKVYSDRFTALERQVSNIYDEAHEPLTGSEMSLLVTTHFEDAPERARFILAQKKAVRDQAALDKQKSELEAAKAAPAPAPQAQAANEGPALSMKLMRVGATFTVANEATTRSRIEAIGGRDVKFKDFPKEGK